MSTHARSAGCILLSLGAVLCAVLLMGCSGEKKIEPVKPAEMESYRDPGYGYSLLYPKGWIANTQVGRAAFYNMQEVDKKFLEPTGPYPDGVSIMVDVMTTPTPDQERQKTLDEMKKNGFVLTPERQIVVGGRQAVAVAYSGQWSTSVKESGQHIYVAIDTLLYDVHFAGFGGYFEAYRAVFDSSLASFQFPRPVIPGRDATLPSDAMVDYNSKLFSFQYPDNFNSINAPKGNNEEVVELRGQRQDCSIRFDVFGAKALTVEKVFDQNKGKYRATATGKTTVSGLPGLTLTYSPNASVERRFVFVVKNDKVYRITLDWFRAQREEYIASYDKVLNSIKIK